MTDADSSKRKEKKRPEEIAIEVKRYEERYEKLLADETHMLQLTSKEYNHEFIVITTKKDGSVKRAIERLGSELAERLLKDNPQKISAKLKRDLKDVVSKASIHEYLEEHHPDWIGKFKPNPKGKNQYSATSSKAASSLTGQEQRFKQAYEQELINAELFQRVIKQLTNKQNQDFVNIRKRTAAGKHWAYTLLEESKQHMLTLAHQMTDSALQDTLDDLRVIGIIADGFSKIVYSVTQQREKQPGA